MTLLAMVSIVAFGAAGILSARITGKESHVLLHSSECGFWPSPSNIATPDDYARLAEFRAKKAEDYNLASTVAAACHKDSIASNCVSYAPRQIEWTKNTNNLCPFEKQMCYYGNTVRFDSGLLHTAQHFGINALKDDRLIFRAVAECAPLVRDGYVSNWHEMSGTRFAPGSYPGDVLVTRPGELCLEWFHGPNLGSGLNSTLIFSDRESTLTMFGEQMYSLA